MNLDAICACCRQELQEPQPFVCCEVANASEYKLCTPCADHRGVMNVCRRRGRVMQKSIQAEIMNQEYTPTNGGLYREMPRRFTLYVSPSDALDVVGVATNGATIQFGSQELSGLHDLTITTKTVEHFMKYEWALAPE